MQHPSNAPCSPATSETGVCLMAVEEGLDTGGVYSRATVADRTDVAPRPSCATSWSTIGTRLLVDALESGLGEPEPQVGEVTYADKIAAGERELDWSTAGRRARPDRARR